jgi:hypothetical protein
MITERYSVHMLIPAKCKQYLYRWSEQFGKLTTSADFYWCDHFIHQPSITEWLDIIVEGDDLHSCVGDARYLADRLRSGMEVVYEGYVYDRDSHGKWDRWEDAYNHVEDIDIDFNV